MSAAVMRRDDLDVLGITPAVGPEKFHLEIGKLDSAVGLWQIVILRPPAHVVAVAPRPAIAVGSSSVGLLQKHLVLAPEVLLEDHALDMRALPH
jgi:hypothetical protein